MRTQYFIYLIILLVSLLYYKQSEVEELKKRINLLQSPPSSSMSSSTAASYSGRGLKAIVVGSTGLVGKNVVRILSQQNPQEYSKIVAISRRKDNPFNYTTSVPIEHVTLDSLDNLDQISEVFNGVDEAYCCLGTTIKRVGNDKQKFRHVDFDYPESFAKLVYKSFSNAAAASSDDPNNLKQFFLVTAVGADSNSMFFYNQVKGDIEKAVAQKQFDYHHFTKEKSLNQSSYCHIIKPGLLIGERENDERFGEKVAQNLNNWFSWAMPRSVSGIKGEEVAKAMVQIAATTRQQKLDVLKERDTHSSIGGVEQSTRFSNNVFAYGNALLKDFADDYESTVRK